jgi:hypothetical protein
MTTLDKLTAEIERSARENDPTALNQACRGLILQLPREPNAISNDLARRTLKALRRHRRFEQIRLVAQAMIDDGCDDPQVRRQYAQALIEGGLTTAAVAVLDDLAASKSTPSDEWAEAKGLLGRVWKDKALAARGKRDAVAAVALKKAYKNYKDVYEKDPSALYQGINTVALAAWDRGLALTPKERDTPLRSAEDIISRVESIPPENRQAWDIATAAEALIALGRNNEAVCWLKDYVVHRDTNAFELASTVRQLTQVWRLGETEDGQALLAPLRARLLELPGGSFAASQDDLRQMATVSKEQYERILGDVGPKTYRWMQKGFDIAGSVALIRKGGSGFGTGFLVKGKDLDERLGEELLVLTNAHVVSDPRRESAALPVEATVSFELAPPKANPGQSYEISKIIWQSPPDQHDASLLRLDPPPSAGLKPVRFHDSLPPLKEDEKQRLYIIGHPGGGDLSFSFEDNELLDYELHLLEANDDPSPCKVHYRTPTKPGSSGSPVFDGHWLTIAIHHKGGQTMKRLNQKEGDYAANEGIWIQSVRRAMAKAVLP